MKRILSVAASAALAITGLAIAPQAASADINCTGTMSGRHDDTIYVPSGRTCTLNSITLDGDVKLASNASVVINGGRISGNVQADEKSPVNVTVKGTSIDGNIQVKYATGAVTVTNSSLTGDIQIEEGTSSITLTGNTLEGNIQVFKNPRGTKTITNNSMRGNLQCKENNPAPTGSGNKAQSLEDQCARLGGSGSSGGSSGSGGSGGGGSTSKVDVYITPGKHNVNGRTWVTTCSKYSTTVDRCLTNIVATQIDYRNGRYIKRTGEVFNNLTYKASPRSQWTKNPLAAYGKYGGTAKWTEKGRQWRTECDSSTTGRNGCRNYVTADVIEQRNGRYVRVTKEVFNSQVRFS
ncbi:MAG: hypothetical protein Q4G35_08460 [Propionibacteriaceae bacterium]|nr:hypothetical protein [Propionibacteriaceae bacterium]